LESTVLPETPSWRDEMTRMPPEHVGIESARVRQARSQRDVLPHLERVVTQQSLFETRASLAGLAHLDARLPAPAAVFLGIGLSAPRELSLALPLDTLGMLLAAEQARRAVAAPSMLILLADAHALTNGHDGGAVAERAAAHGRTLGCVIERLGWSHVHVVRARELHALPAHARLHAQIREVAPRDEHPYVTRELADIEYFARHAGSLLKVGWALQSGVGSGLRDERAFDERFRCWVGRHVGFVYCKAGRTLDDQRRKAPPYLVRDPARRVCLIRGEHVREKLERASEHVSVSTVRGVRKHLKAITRSYKQLVRPLSGRVEEQVQTLLGQLLGPGGSA
jgi:hypothetical protein